jgi:hypothetical protein
MDRSPSRRPRNKALILARDHQSLKIKRKRIGRSMTIQNKINLSKMAIQLQTSRRNRTCVKLSTFKNRSLKTDAERNTLKS